MSSGVSRNPSSWPAARRRFILYGVLGTIWCVGISVTFGLYVGGPADALFTGGLLLVSIAVALGVAYTRLRRKYLLGV